MPKHQIIDSYGGFTWGGRIRVYYNDTLLTTENVGANHVIWTADTTELQLRHFSEFNTQNIKGVKQ